MAQIARTTTGMTSINVTTLQNLINTLTANMAAGKSITASDMNQLISAYNTWRQHTHQASDLRGQDTYGNKTTYGAAGTYAAVKTTTAALSTGGVAFAVSSLVKASTNPVLATDANEAVNKINAVRSHKHQIDDVTS